MRTFSVRSGYHRRGASMVSACTRTSQLFTLNTNGYVSRSVEVRVEGRVVSERGGPLPEEEIHVTLSPRYGYFQRRLDDAPGTKEVAATVTTDANGAFAVTGGGGVLRCLLARPPRRVSEPAPSARAHAGVRE